MEMYGAVRRPRFILFMLLLLAAVFWVCVLYFRLSALISGVAVAPMERMVSFAARYEGRSDDRNKDPCQGRRVYIHELPPRFNADMLSGCGSTDGRWPNMCEQVSNAGLGETLPEPEDEGEGEGALSGAAGWYATQQFALDAIFHGRMLQYDCLTNDSSEAAAVFVPFYAGFDFARHLWGYDNATRDAASLDMERWLVGRPEWRRAGGRDHFLVAGRTAWDFRRDTCLSPTWGTNLLFLPAAKNMTVLVVESSTASGHGNDMAVPYPTYFHPRTDADVLHWQQRIKSAARPWLMSFVGAPRPGDPRSIRSQIIAQCGASSACRQLGCASGASQCHTPGDIMQLFQSSTFCLQPPGDSYTRRSVFDAMVAGCVPVFFHPASAYLQYKWHLPDDHARYSVFIPDDSVRVGNVSIEDTLRRIPGPVVRRMQEEVIRLVPSLVYADPRYSLDTVKDAFDVAVEGVIQKVAESMRKAQTTDRRSSWLDKIWFE